MKELLELYRAEASKCTCCQSTGLINCNLNGEWARPLFHLEGTFRKKILFVFEAPNYDDTYNTDKGYITCDPDTDPSGRLMFELLAHIGLSPLDVLITNTVLCLPAKVLDRYPVRSGQLKACSPWLKRLILDLNPKIVVTCGAKALHATNLLEKHGLKLSSNVGVLHDWFGRKILSLYHPSRLGLVSRSKDQQLTDIEILIPFLQTG